jgi:hypothetical protein
MQERRAEPDQVVVRRGAVEPGRQDAAAVVVAEDRLAPAGVTRGQRDLAHPPHAIGEATRERGAVALGDRHGNQQHLERKPVVGQRRLEPDAVGQHLRARLALQHAASV